MRFLPVLLLVLALAWAADAEFQQVNLTVNVNVNHDGTALVTETIRLSMDSGSPVIYDSAMSAYDLASWKSKTKLDLRFHFNRDVADITDVSIRAQPRDSCFGCVRDVCTVCYGTLIVRYRLSPIVNKTDSGLFRMNRFKPRTMNYSINPDALSFESSGQGIVVLPESTVLTITIPDGAFNVSVNPLPEEMQGTGPFTPPEGLRTFSWHGRTSLTPLELSFKIEEPLSVEVIGFFNSVRDEVLRVLYSKEGLAIVIISAVVLVSVIVLKRREGQ